MSRLNLNQAPYFDDYDEFKKFYKILFRPGYPVQARELTQIQTLLQKQIERMGSHVFENGAQVFPGDKEGVRYTNNHGWIKIPTDSFSDTSDKIETYWLNKTITNVAGVTAKIIGYRESDEINEVRLYLTYLSAADQQVEFQANESIETIETVPVTSTIVPTNSVGTIASVTVTQGVYYVNGNFVLVDEQQLFLIPADPTDQEDWTNDPTALVGLEIEEIAITSQDDPSIFDNAVGAPNYSAPGADRLKIMAHLVRKPLNHEDPDFVALLKVVNGVVRARVTKTEMSVLGDTLARRTYDESGDYVVKPFVAEIKDFLLEGDNQGVHSEQEFWYYSEAEAKVASQTYFGFPDDVLDINGEVIEENGVAAQHPTEPGVWIPGTSYNTAGDDTSFIQLCHNKLSIQIDPGKAYVKGYEYEKISTTIVDINKSRTRLFRNNQTINTPLGTHFRIKNMFGAVNVDEYDIVDLHSEILDIDPVTGMASHDPNPLSKIGQARVSAVEYYSGSSGSEGVYSLFLFNVEPLTSELDLINVKSLSSGSPTFRCNCELATFRLSGSVSRTGLGGEPAGNILYGIGTSWKNDENQTLRVGDYVRVGQGETAAIYRVIQDPKNDNELLIDVDLDGTPGDWSDGSTLDYLFASLDTNSQQNGLLFSLPDEYVYSLRSNLTHDTIDTSFLSRRILPPQTPTGTPPKATYLSNLGEDFDLFSVNGYVVIGLASGLWYKLIPGTGAEPPIGTAAIRATGSQLEVWLNAADTEEIYVIASVLRYEGNASKERAKNLVKGYFDAGVYNGPYVIVEGSESSSISLGKADVLRITRVVESPDDATDPDNKQVLDSGHQDVTAAYILDNGQRDSYYDIARLTLRSGYQRPVGKIRVEFDYFEDGGGGEYYSVNSYAAYGPGKQMEYEDIPIYIASDGTEYQLNSVIDFRPRVLEPATVAGVVQPGGGLLAGFANSLELPRGTFRTDYFCYEGRRDKLCLDKSGIFFIQGGVPSLDPQPPMDPSTALALYEIELPPYTAHAYTCRLLPLKTRRYTMRDIGKLEERISNLEYYTTLSMLEKDTNNLIIKDALGNDKFKNGFLVDNFKSFASSAIGSGDYRCSIDRFEGVASPLVYEDNVSLFERNLLETNPVQRDNLRKQKRYQKTGDLYTLPYTKSRFIQQEKASKVININPYRVFTFTGSLELYPWTDEWRDVKNMEPLTIRDSRDYDAIRSTFGPSGTKVDKTSTQTYWTGVDTTKKKTNKPILLQAGHAVVETLKKAGKYKDFTKGVKAGHIRVPNKYSNAGDVIPIGKSSLVQNRFEIVETQTGKQITTGLQHTLEDLGWVNYDLGNRIVSTDAAEWIRSREITFKATCMAPNVRVTPYFDAVNVSSHCKPTGGVYGNSLVTNAFGTVEGVFKIPNTPQRRFRTGDRVFSLRAPNNSIAEARYTARGWIDNTQQTIMSVRTFKVNTNLVTDEVDVTNTKVDYEFGKVCPADPIAQSFFIDASGGCFITDVDIYFYQKDPTLPVRLQIRPLDAGGNPSNLILPFGEVTKQAAEVVTNAVTLGVGASPTRYTITGNNGSNPAHPPIPGVDTGPWTSTTPVRNKSGRGVVSGVSYNLAIVGGKATDHMIPTRFTFESPIYLQEKESYAIVLLSDSDRYTIWVAESGKFIPEEGTETFGLKSGSPSVEIGTDKNIDKDPFLGVMFKSQNGISWTPAQTLDMKFDIWKAEFDIRVNGEIEFVNSILPSRELILDPFMTVAGSSQIRVTHPAHGMCIGSKVKFDEVTSTASNGIPDWNTLINRDEGFDIILTEMDSYVIDLGTGNEATTSGRIGGDGSYATENKRFSELELLTNPLVLPQTEINWAMIATTSRGVNDYVNIPYLIASSKNIEAYTPIELDVPHQISSWINELPAPLGPAQLGNGSLGDQKSIKIRAILKSENTNLSPIIDSSRLSVVTTDYRLDNPHGIAGDGIYAEMIINGSFDDYECIPTTRSPLVTSGDTEDEIYFTSSNRTLTGTLSSTGSAVTGLGTVFESELSIGSIIKDSSTGQHRKVVSIDDNTHLTVDFDFSPDLSASTVYILNPLNLRIKTAHSNIAKHLSQLDTGKYVTLAGATGDRSFVDKIVSYVDYTPHNTEVDADLGAPRLCQVEFLYQNNEPSGLEASAITIIQKDRYVDEIAPVGGSCSAKYICRPLLLAREANALKISFDASRDENSRIDLYYRIENVSGSRLLEHTTWTKAEYNLEVDGVITASVPEANLGLWDFSSYECNLNSLPDFKSVQIKIVFRGGNVAFSPHVMNFRVIALAE